MYSFCFAQSSTSVERYSVWWGLTCWSMRAVKLFLTFLKTSQVKIKKSCFWNIDLTNVIIFDKRLLFDLTEQMFHAGACLLRFCTTVKSLHFLNMQSSHVFHAFMHSQGMGDLVMKLAYFLFDWCFLVGVGGGTLETLCFPIQTQKCVRTQYARSTHKCFLSGDNLL